MQLAAPSGLRLWFLNYEKIWLEIKRGVSLRLSLIHLLKNKKNLAIYFKMKKL
jgi:hypothetical protein